MTSISLIIVNFNGRHLLDRLLASVSAQTRKPDQVIIVDNASTDGSTEHLRSHFPWIETVSLETNLGFAEANNIGLRKAAGDFICLLNPDTKAAPGFIAALETALESNPEMGAAVARIFKLHPPGMIDAVGAQFNNLGQCWSRGFNQSPDQGFEKPVQVAGITACAAMLRRKALGDERIFDPDFFMYYEELELTLQMRGKGWGVLYVPQAEVHHIGSALVRRSQKNPMLFQQFYGNRNRAKILMKYYSWPHLLRNLPLIGLSFAYWNWFFLRHGGARYFLKAMSSQVQFAIRGIQERGAAGKTERKRWMPWMTRHRLRDLLELSSALQIRK